jgi:monofunctional biosynthetic peptidoglycan transglycosylase
MSFFSKINNKKSLFKKFILLLFSLWIFSIGIVVFYRFVPVFFTPVMGLKALTDGNGIHQTWVPLNEISKYMSKAVIRSEDAKFYDHYGFDFEAIQKAQAYNKTHKKTKGASTISQQTAKNVFLWPARSYLRKGLEAYFTVLIELIWPKDRIIEVYLNIIELGPGVYGVESASQKFFKKPAKKLTMSEAALMAAVLPNPIKFKINHPSSYIRKRQSKIMGRIQSTKPIIENDDLDTLDNDFLQNSLKENDFEKINSNADQAIDETKTSSLPSESGPEKAVQ